MTSEDLLEAVGLLDDDLILEAERAPVRRPVRWQQWLGLCACLALVFLVGRGMVQNWSGSSTSGNASTSVGAGEASGSAGSAGASSGTASLPDGSVYILVDNRSYLSTGETVSELPAGAEALGVLSEAEDGAPSPSTNGAEYVGCPLYAGPEGNLYAELSQDTYAVFALAEP